MSDNSSNNKRIAKNTFYLYLRMILSTLVSLYTARLTLKLLGIEDYGIYNVVGGIVGFMSIVTTTMTSATQRFLAYDLGQNDEMQFRKTFSMLLNVFLLLCIISILVLELVGPVFIDNRLTIPGDRMVAAQWCFQFSIVIFFLRTMQIPYLASIVAYEEMRIYAYLTLVDVAFQLCVVYLLYVTPYDRLITFGALMMMFNVILNVITYLYCRIRLKGCLYIRVWDNKIMKKLGGYAGWSMFGSITNVMNHQGQAIVLNMFFGPIVNGAKAIADKINSIISSFSSNFYMAVSPQIIKSYAADNISYTRNLVLCTSRYAYYLLFVISVPLILNMNDLLVLWLGKEQTTYEMVIFSQLILVYSLVNVLEQPITTAIRATGDIKKYQIWTGILTLLFIPICYLMFVLGMPAYSSMIALTVLYLIVQFVRVYIVRTVIDISLRDYLNEVLFPILLVSFITIAPLCYLVGVLHNFVLNLFLTASFTLSIILAIGLNNKEKQYVLNYFRKRKHFFN